MTRTRNAIGRVKPKPSAAAPPVRVPLANASEPPGRTPPAASVWERFHTGVAGKRVDAPAAPPLNRFAETMFTVGAQAFMAGQPEAAEISLRMSIGAGGNDFAALGLLGLMAIERKDFAAAAGWLRAALVVNPDEPTTLNNLGEALRRDDQFDAAIACYRRALAVAPDYADAYDNLGCALAMSNRPAEALAQHHRAIALKPEFALAHERLSEALVGLNRHEAALRALRLGMTWEPDQPKARLNEAYILLALGRFALGWKAYEARWDAVIDGVPALRRHGDRPRLHRSTRLAGKTLLLHAEQGFGDTLQFVRYAPMLTHAGARVIVEAQAPLVALLRSAPGVTQVVAIDDPLPAFDLQCPLLSLPLACGTTLASIPAEVPYLTPSPERIAAWRRRLGRRRAGRRRIAIAWSGNPDHANDRNRSIPLRQVLSFLDRSDGELHVAQTQIRTADRSTLDQWPEVTDHSAALQDFADTAALLSLMDLVICVDTAVAHVAGAMARPTWLLLPFSAEWRWLVGRSDTPWYPTMRLFRQAAPGDWDSVLAAVAQALDE